MEALIFYAVVIILGTITFSIVEAYTRLKILEERINVIENNL